MARSAQRRNSMDFWADFDVFISLFEENRHHMEDQVHELGLIRHDTQPVWTKHCSRPVIKELMWYAYAALVFAYMVDEFSSPQPSTLAKLTAGVAVLCFGKVCFEKMRQFQGPKKAETLLVRLQETMARLDERMEALEERMEALEACPMKRWICWDLPRARRGVKALSSTVQQFRSRSFSWDLLLKATEQSKQTMEQVELLCENLARLRTGETLQEETWMRSI